MSDTNRNKGKSPGNDEAEQLYELYMRVQSGDKAALNELFKETDSKHICRLDEMNKEYRLSHMDNVLDSESILDSEKNEREKEWLDSASSKVVFRFFCLNRLLYKKKRYFLSRAKNTGYENGKRVKGNNYSKFYEGEYDISDFNELMYETVIEIFNTKTDETNCLTLDGKRNEGAPICDGVSLLKNISYFTSRKINKRAKGSCLDIPDLEYFSEELDMEVSYFDQYEFKKFLEAGGRISRLTMYEEYLDWIKQHDAHKLFKATSSNIRAIIETIMNCDKTFIADTRDGIEIGPGMRFVTQKALKDIIKLRYNINIAQENISKNLEIIEQRLLDHLLYSLNYKIGKAGESTGVYRKESERFLYALDTKSYIKIFSRAAYEIYNKSINFINSDRNCDNDDRYFKTIKKYEEIFMEIVSLERGKKKYDMVNLIFENDDLVDDRRGTLIDIANTIKSFYQKEEEKSMRNRLGDYKIKGFADWDTGCWEAELEDGVLKMKLWSNRNVKKPIQDSIDKEKLDVYCGYMNFYFCNTENKACYRVPKSRRVISRANKEHEFFMYHVG